MAGLRTRLLIDYYLGGLLHAILKPFVVLLGKILKRDHRPENCSDVTYLKLLGGGSIVMAYPSLLAMRRNPNIRKLRLLATNSTVHFGRILGIFDEIILIRDTSLWTIIIDATQAIWLLFRTDAIIDLEVNSRLSTVLTLLTMARNRVGAYTESSFWRRGLSTHLLFYNRCSPIYGFYDQIAVLFGCQAPPFSECIETFRKHVGALKFEVSNVQNTDIAIAPCCSDLSRERMMRESDWETVLGRVLKSERPTRVHLLGGASDRGYLDTLAAQLSSIFTDLVFENQAGKLKLDQSVALLGKVSRLICIDSALLHLARLQGVSTTSYWGPTDPETLLRPSTVAQDVVQYERIACSPCVHIANTAPCNGNNICMRAAVDNPSGLDRNPLWLA